MILTWICWRGIWRYVFGGQSLRVIRWARNAVVLRFVELYYHRLLLLGTKYTVAYKGHIDFPVAS